MRGRGAMKERGVREGAQWGGLRGPTLTWGGVKGTHTHLGGG